MSQIDNMELLGHLDLGDGRKMEFHHFEATADDYIELYYPKYNAENPNRLIVPMHYHHDHDEYIYLVEGKIKAIHQLWNGPGLLWGKKTKWTETLLDAFEPGGKREVKLDRNLKHSLEQVPGYAMRLRESSNPSDYIINKEFFFREFFLLGKMPSLPLLFSTFGSRGDFYVGFDMISYVLAWIGRLFYPTPRVSKSQLEAHYQHSILREESTAKTHPWLYDENGNRIANTTAEVISTLGLPEEPKKQI